MHTLPQDHALNPCSTLQFSPPGDVVDKQCSRSSAVV